ncbi:MAG: amino acid adenylation domain-containing protein, partial [Proteobacteria bacterium]|nr:amino acid adenylation domain-containing protein [Pseudomonadota bacterium]
IDPQYPAERAEYILMDSKASLLITHKIHQDLINAFSEKQIIFIDDDQVKNEIDLQSNSAPAVKIYPQDRAYILYTSGSTGKPKGVAVTHENVICLFESLKKQFSISEQDIWSMFHTYCFDISVWELWGAFVFGGALVVFSYEISRNPKLFYELLKTEQVTVLTQTSSAFQMLIHEDMSRPVKLNSLRYVAFVGESLKVSILRPWVEKYGFEAPKLANMYGITETTVYTNYKFISKKDIEDGRDNIGWPLEEFSMCVLDDNLQWCPVGIVGEIYIGGRGLSRGYLYKEALTQQKFIADPHADFLGLNNNSKLYRTGDLGRWLDDGSIEYLGRKDFQIKLRGFRIELGEIEAALGSYPLISQAIILLKGESEYAFLAAYYTTKGNIKINLSLLRTHIKSFLPEYMIPTTYLQLAAFPMTVNGKVDRQALLAMDEKLDIDNQLVSPHTELENTIINIWSHLLKIDILKIALNSSFFELGGNSLLVIIMLAEVSKITGKEILISQFMGVPTIAALAAQIDNDSLSKGFIQGFVQRLKDDIILDNKIKPLIADNPLIHKPKNILITGATGFLGAHLLHELLNRTTAKIYCLVRAENQNQALAKIVEKSIKHFLSSHHYTDRIIPITGDLSLERLGLLSADFDILAREIDVIYHVAAWVHHLLDYSQLYHCNVASTVELLRISTLVKNKALHFISTLNAAYLAPFQEQSTNSNNFEEQQWLHFNGYLLSKWVSEQLMHEAKNRNIVAHVYRPGNITAGITGVSEPEMNHTLLRLKGILQLGKAYIDPKENFEMMPVDILAKIIVDISFHPKEFSYNLDNKQKMSWLEYLNFARNLGYNIKFLENREEWDIILSNLDVNNALYPFAHLYKRELSIINNNPVEEGVSKNNWINVPPYHEMIDRQLSFLIKTGFLSEPSEKFVLLNGD